MNKKERDLFETVIKQAKEVSGLLTKYKKLEDRLKLGLLWWFSGIFFVILFSLITDYMPLILASNVIMWFGLGRVLSAFIQKRKFIKIIENSTKKK
jgi:VIT1/CCC1 family predicted Fe2+/Mn2+ transporter